MYKILNQIFFDLFCISDFSKDHQPVVPAHQQHVRVPIQPVKNIVPIQPLKEDTYKLINEEDIKHTELIDESLQNRGQQIDDDLKTIELSVGKDRDIDRETVSEIDYGVHDQREADEDRIISNITASAVKTHETNSITYVRKSANSTVRNDKQQQPVKKSYSIKPNEGGKKQLPVKKSYSINPNQNSTHQKVFHVEHGSGGLDASDAEPKELDRSQGDPSFWRRVDKYCNPPNQPVTGEEGE